MRFIGDAAHGVMSFGDADCSSMAEMSLIQNRAVNAKDIRTVVFGSSPSDAFKPMSRSFSVTPVSRDNLLNVKQAFSTRRVDLENIKSLIRGPIRPRSGDLVLAEMVSLGYQRRLELTNGRKAQLHVGDLILVAYGARYATDQFEAEVPRDLRRTNLVATGGIAARMISRNSSIRTASVIQPLGLLGGQNGRVFNLRQFALPSSIGHSFDQDRKPDQAPVFAVLGTSMNSGKTTCNEALVRGLTSAGLRAAVVKVTGTASGGDYWTMLDSGAHLAADFTDAGYASTYRVPLTSIEEILADLVTHARASDADVVLIEIADGIFQEQNIDLIRSPAFARTVDKVLFSAGEAMGAAMGVVRLRELNLPIAGVSGKVTASALGIRETVAATNIPVFTRADMEDPAKAVALVFGPLPRNELDCSIGEAVEVLQLPESWRKKPSSATAMASVVG